MAIGQWLDNKVFLSNYCVPGPALFQSLSTWPWPLGSLGLGFCLCHLLSVGPGTSSLVFFALYLRICRMGTVIVPVGLL